MSEPRTAYERIAWLRSLVGRHAAAGQGDRAALASVLLALELSSAGRHDAALDAARAAQGHEAGPARKVGLLTEATLLLEKWHSGEQGSRTDVERALDSFVEADDAGGAAECYGLLAGIHTRAGHPEAAALCREAATRAAALRGTSSVRPPPSGDEPARWRERLVAARRDGDEAGRAEACLQLIIALASVESARGDVLRFASEAMLALDEAGDAHEPNELNELIDRAAALVNRVSPLLAAELRRRRAR